MHHWCTNFRVLLWRYVLLHHVMGELEKEKGAWGYVEGGMGGVSQAIASSARSYGADIFTEKVFWLWSWCHVLVIFKWVLYQHPHCARWQDVEQVLVGSDCAAKGVVLKDGTEIHSKVVLSNATPRVTFRKLTPQVFPTASCPRAVTIVPKERLTPACPSYCRVPFLQSSSAL